MEKTFNNLPIFEASLKDDDLGIFTIALVDWPAMQKRWEFFGAEKEPLKYSILSEAEHRVISPIIRADYPILRRSDDGRLYYITFPKETVYAAAQRFLESGLQGFVKVTHNPEADYIDGFKLVQWYIKDSERGINPAGFEDVAEGSLFAEYFVTDEALWRKIVDGTFNGLSMESVFSFDEPKEDEQEEINTIEELVKYLGVK